MSPVEAIKETLKVVFIFMALLAIQGNPSQEATNPKDHNVLIHERGSKIRFVNAIQILTMGGAGVEG